MKRDVYGLLSDLRTILTGSDVPLFPVICPKCRSLKITVVFGTASRLECLDCGSKFRIVEDRSLGGGRGGQA